MEDSLLEEECTSSLICTHQRRPKFSTVKALCKRFRAFLPIAPTQENSIIRPINTPITSCYKQKEKEKKKEKEKEKKTKKKNTKQKKKRKGFGRLGFRTRHLLWPIKAILRHSKKLSFGCKGHIRWKKLEESSPPNCCSANDNKAWKIPKGHIPVEVGSQHERFVVPLIYLNNPLFQQLLMEAHGVFGFDQDGALTLPCTPAQFQHTAWLIKHIA